jgi:peptide deformylase
LTVREILKLGNPTLYKVSAPITQDELPEIEMVVQDLHDTMMNFRAEYNAGRAIAAPQIGVMKRLIYMNVTKPVILINPVLQPQNPKKMEVWDDCMCFPELLVKVERYQFCRITYRNLDWNECVIDLEGDLSELLQHEFDHLDGILAVSRAMNGQAFALRSQRPFLLAS